MRKISAPRWVVVLAVFLPLVFARGAAAGASSENASGESGPQIVSTGQARAEGGVLSTVSEYMEHATDQLNEAGQGLLAIPDLAGQLSVMVRNPDNLILWAKMAGWILLVLLAGFLAEWIVRRILRKQCRSVENRQTDSIPLRGLLSAVRIFLEIIPIAVFAAAAYTVLPFVGMHYDPRLIALTLINAIVLTRIILAVFRIVLIPRTASIRVLSITEESSFYLYIWMRRIVGLGVYGYFILEAVLLAGVPEALHGFMLKFLGFAVTVMLVVLLMQNRKEVGGWLHGEKAAPGSKDEKEFRHRARRILLNLRSRLADFWHIAAVLVIVGIFAVWVLEIEGAFFFLVSGLAMTIVVVGAAALLAHLVHKGVDRLFLISEDLKAAYPDLEYRANRYQPAVRGVLKSVVYVVAAFAALHVWGLGTLGWLFSSAGAVVVGDVVTLALIIAGAFLLWEIVSALIERSLARETTESGGSTRKQTLLPLLKNVVRILLVVIGGMLVLSQLGVNIAPLLAGAGIIGLAVGFGAQALVKDVITGAFILLEDSISVGDWVEAGGHSGTVEHLSVRTVKLRDLSGTVQVVPFGEVTTVSNYNRDYGYALIDAGVAYRESYGQVVQALQDVAVELRNDELLGSYITGDLELFGLNNLGDSAVEIRVRIKTLPMRHFKVRRAFLERMKRVFDERGIEIPFPHRTIWFGVDNEGTAPPLYIADSGKKQDFSSPEKQETGEAGLQSISELEASKDVVEEKEEAPQEESKQ
ncbi:MAG: mechanosensitive ion channel [Desulfobacteraceae bacterium]|nr:mechanosensitive ion channel [Desulfobacteraceae bacterium]